MMNEILCVRKEGIGIQVDSMKMLQLQKKHVHELGIIQMKNEEERARNKTKKRAH